jgi:hypothetical protein
MPVKRESTVRLDFQSTYTDKAIPKIQIQNEVLTHSLNTYHLHASEQLNHSNVTEVMVRSAITCI